MAYPKRSPSKDNLSKQTISKQQREDLKRLLAKKFQSIYKVQDQDALQVKIDKALGAGDKITGEQLENLNNHLKHTLAPQYSESPNMKKAGKSVDDDVLSLRSDYSKMSGASNLNELDNKNVSKSQPLILDSRTARPNAQPSQYKFEEEEWADIYKHNREYFKEEDRLEKIRQAENRKRFKDELDFQVRQKKALKERNSIDKQVDHEQIMMRVQREEVKEQRKIIEMKEKIMYEKQLRDQQLIQLKIQRKQDLKASKSLDKILLQQIRDQIVRDDENQKNQKQQELNMMKKVINDIEENKKRREQQQQREREEDINIQQKYNEMVQAQEQRRQEEFKVKEERIRQIMEAGKLALVQLHDEKLKKQEDKLKHWEEKNDRRIREAERAEKEYQQQRRLEIKAYLEQQIEEKRLKNQEEKEKYYQQGAYWKNESQKFQDFQRSREGILRERQKQYAQELKKQVDEKLEEKRIGNLLLSLRESVWKKKL